MISKFLIKLKSILFKSSAPAELPLKKPKKTIKSSKSTKTTKSTKSTKSTKITKSKPKKEDAKKIIASLTTLPGIGSKSAKALYEAGFKSTKAVISAKDDELLSIPGVGINLVKKLKKLK